MASENRKKYLKAWLDRITQHLLNPSLLLKRLRTPRKSIQLFIAPFIDVKLKATNSQQLDSILANSLRTLLELDSSQVKTSTLDQFSELGSTKSIIGNTSSLSSLFEKYGSDKARNNYTIFYEKIIEERLNNSETKLQILEIGLGTNNIDVPSNMGIHGKPGASLRAFRDYSPRISVVGADVDRRILFEEERIKTFYLDQLKPSTFSPIMEMAHESDIIIDDGLHTSQANLNVVYLFKEALRGGSWLVIEDIGKTELNLKLWSVVSRLLNDFESTILDLPNTYIFLAQKKLASKV